MSGHSKWSTIKRKKGANDAARGKIFGKISKEIMIAVREGGADPTANTRLRTAIIKARSENMPNTNIDRVIKKSLGEFGNINYEEVCYEGYAGGGTAILVRCFTENKNRTGPEVRHTFSKYGGNIGELGCVSYMFSRKGIIVVDITKHKEEEVFETVLDIGIENVQSDGDGFEIETSPENFTKVMEVLETQSYTILHAEISQVPDSYVIQDEETTASTLILIEQLEELDDVQSVSHNLDLSE